MSDDELAPYDDSPVVAALRAPATAEELRGEADALAMFRTTTASRRGRGVRRVAVGGAGIVLGLGLTGGVAAAYSDALPDPMQNAFNSAIAPLGVPAPPRAHPRARLHRLLTRPHPSAATSPHVTPSVPAVVPAPQASRPPASRPTPRPASSPGATPAPAPPTWAASVSRRVVPVHGTVVLSGVLTRDGVGLAGRHVYAAELPAGTSTWRRVADGRTGSDGRISLTVPALTTNVRLRLVTEQGTRSAQLAITVVPKLSLSTARNGAQRVVTVTADGGRAGDTVVLQRRDGDTWTSLMSQALDGSRAAQFTVPGPRANPVRYRVRLAPTQRHAAAFAWFTVPAR